MENYWFYLEPFTFLFEKNGFFVVYNTISNQGKRFKNSGKTGAIVKQLLDINNMYCVSISEIDLSDADLLDFVNYIRGTFSGDLIEANSISKKPVVFAPKFKINKTLEQLQETDSRLTSDDVLSYFNELSIYIGGDKPTSALLKFPVYKQFDYNKDLKNQQLPINHACYFISQVEHSPLGVINILGGNIFTHPHLNELAKELKRVNATKTYNVCYGDIPANLNQYEFLRDEKATLKILVDFPLNPGKFNNIVSLINATGIKTSWLFAITSLDEFDEAELLIQQNNLSKTLIKPFYTGDNLPLFSNNVYMDEEDILSTRLSRNDIFMRQVLNTYDFGKLTLMADGKVYANVNHPPIGLYSDSVVKMILDEMTKNSSWRRIRNQKPCCDCLYQWLCPSPSNYEMAISRTNLCSVEFSM